MAAEIKISADIKNVQKALSSIAKEAEGLGKKKFGINLDPKTLEVFKKTIKGVYDELEKRNKDLSKVLNSLGQNLTKELDPNKIKAISREISNISNEITKNTREMKQLFGPAGMSAGGAGGQGGGGFLAGLGGMRTALAGLGIGAAFYGIKRMMNPAFQSARSRTQLRGLGGMSGSDLYGLQRQGMEFGFSPEESRQQGVNMLRSTGSLQGLAGVQTLSAGTGIGVDELTGVMGNFRNAGMANNKSLELMQKTFTEAVAAGFDKSRAFDALQIVAGNTAAMASGSNVDPQKVKDIIMNFMSSGSFFSQNADRANVAAQSLDRAFTSSGPLAGVAYRSLLGMNQFKGMRPIELERIRGLGLFGSGGAGLEGAQQFLGQFGTMTTGRRVGKGTNLNNQEFASFSVALRDSLGIHQSLADEIVKAFVEGDNKSLKEKMGQAQKSLEENIKDALTSPDANLGRIAAATESLQEEFSRSLADPLMTVADYVIKIHDLIAPVFQSIGGGIKGAMPWNNMLSPIGQARYLFKQGKSLISGGGVQSPQDYMRGQASSWLGSSQMGANANSNISGRAQAEGMRQLGLNPGGGILNPRAAQYDAFINQIALEKGIDPNLMKAIIQEESAFNTNSINRSPGFNSDGSPRGGAGLAQFIPSTGKKYGLFNTEDRLNPFKTLPAMGQYLSDMQAKGMSPEQMVWSYIGGDAQFAGGKPHLNRIMNRKKMLDNDPLAAVGGSDALIQAFNKLLMSINNTIEKAPVMPSPITNIMGATKMKSS